MPRPRILILEPYLPTGQALAVILRRAGWDVMLSQTDRDMLEAMKQSAYDVLLVDLDVITGDGWRVLQTLGPASHSLPILAMLDQESAQHQRARSLGASILLPKPVERKRLLSSATAALEGG